MRTIDKIITAVDGTRGAPIGRSNVGSREAAVAANLRIYDCAVRMMGAYDYGGAYWGLGKQLRVEYTKDLSYIKFYRK